MHLTSQNRVSGHINVNNVRLVWVKKDKPEIEKYASKYNDFKKEQFDKLQHQSDEEPVLVCGIYVGWTK